MAAICSGSTHRWKRKPHTHLDYISSCLVWCICCSEVPVKQTIWPSSYRHIHSVCQTMKRSEENIFLQSRSGGTRATAQSQQPLCEKPGRGALHSPAHSVEQGKTRSQMKTPSALQKDRSLENKNRSRHLSRLVCCCCKFDQKNQQLPVTNSDYLYGQARFFMRCSDCLWMILHSLASYTPLNSNNYTPCNQAVLPHCLHAHHACLTQ